MGGSILSDANLEATHYHVNTFSGDGTQVTVSEYVYRRKEDADAALADARMRAGRADTPFSPEDLDDERVRGCSDSACIGEDG
jgi:hypothetical protein